MHKHAHNQPAFSQAIGGGGCPLEAGSGCFCNKMQPASTDNEFKPAPLANTLRESEGLTEERSSVNG